MPYPKKLRNSFETVELDLPPHWWFFSGPVSALVGSIIAGIAVRFLGEGDARDVLSLGALALIVICVLWVLVTYARWCTTNVVVTSDRLIFRTGVLAKSGSEIPLERVNNVNFSESIFAYHGIGRLVINSIANRDYPVVQGTLMLVVLIFLITNIIVDASYAFLDPRVKLERAR